MSHLRDFLCDAGLCILLIAIACLGVLDDRSKRPKDVP